MSLRPLPEIQAFKLPDVCAYHTDDAVLDKWNASLAPAATSNNTISVLDVIGEDPWSGGGVTSKRVAGALRAIGEGDITVEVNSPGGDFFEGVAIYNLLRGHKGKVTVRVLGLAASAASVIAMAGDEVLIGKAGFLMVHNAWVMAVGNRHDLAEAATTMATFDAAMASVYADRAGVDEKSAAAWMDKETWFSGSDAVENGLADAFLPDDQVTTAKAAAPNEFKAVNRVDALLAKQGLPRSERRALLNDVKGATHDAGLTVTQDADEIEASAVAGLFKI